MYTFGSTLVRRKYRACLPEYRDAKKVELIFDGILGLFDECSALLRTQGQRLYIYVPMRIYVELYMCINMNVCVYIDI